MFCWEHDCYYTAGRNETFPTLPSSMADNIYVQAADIFTNALAKKAHVKSLVYASKYPNKKKLYALVCQGLKYQNILHEIATSLNILKNETYALRQNMPLLQLLLYDKIFGKGICGSRRFKNVMRKYRDKINNHCELLIKEKGLDNVKELLTYDNENGMLDMLCFFLYVCHYYCFFKDLVEGTTQCDWTENHVYTTQVCLIFTSSALILSLILLIFRFVNAVEFMNSGEFLRDLHIPSLLVFPAGSEFHEHPLYLSGEIVLQEKEIPTFPRFSLDVDFRIHFVLFSISFSPGIISRMDNVLDSNPTTNDRLQKLYFIQRKLLIHALSFPSVKRVVYSTCSVFPEENEQVIDTVFQMFQKEYCLKEIMPDFPHRGLEGYQSSKYCLRFASNIDKTNGFFVACFVRRDLSLVESNPEQL
ncbi:28S rRNA (cytosine-C(5))-methyltransferase [Octopus bimaculoides]|uniref:28S rRNA (cytosine-C(5))-methyltransferase n=1 Tax=Octopus bimaculoides TaxID=37653 RepID=UPI0022E058CD|nr:28S rRNA (cytosine-C(5))-methyltransferase [Octopus bimaculoides]